jgi:H+/Cl- antiporter ClcA
VKTFFNFTLIMLFIGIVPLGFVFEKDIHQYIPDYSALMHLCATVFFAGLSYTIVTRNIIVMAITILCTVAIPYVKVWFVYYWLYNPFIIARFQ